MENYKMEKMIYIMHPDFDYIEKCIDSGITTLLCTTCSLPSESTRSKWNWDSIKPVLEKYKDDPRVKLIFCPLLIPLHGVVTEEAFFDGNKYLSHTYCPSKNRQLKSKIQEAKNIAKQYNAELIYDTEEYTHERNSELLRIYVKNLNEYWPKYECKCQSCSGKSKTEQWKMHVKSIREELIEMNYSGQYPNRPMWFNKAFPKLHFFTEDTYMSFKPFYVWFNILVKNFIWGNRMKLFAGIWMEKFSDNDFRKYIKKLGKSILFDGYWIYPQTRLSRTSPFKDDGTMGYYNDSLADGVDPDFFIKLKKLNEEIDKYRNESLWFKFKSLFRFWTL